MGQRRKRKGQQIRVYSSSENYDKKHIYLKLFSSISNRVTIEVVDEYGQRVANGSLLWIENDGVSFCLGVGDFDIKKDEYGRLKING